MHIDVLTLFPELFERFATTGIVGRAVRRGLASIRCVNFRDFARDKHRSVDDRTFGGGSGMVLMCGPVFDALAQVEADRVGEPTRILLTPQGEPLRQAVVEGLSKAAWLVILCGRYEGFDERIRSGIVCREISIGDYVLSGGEPAAMVLMDAVVRLLPGALGAQDATTVDSFADGVLEYPQYTRPRNFRGMEVPEVLVSGDHGRIAEWRRGQALQRTQARRPDLLDPGGSATPTLCLRGATDGAGKAPGHEGPCKPKAASLVAETR